MNSLTDVPPDGGAVSLDPLTATEVWNTATGSTQAGNLNGANSTLVYIAVSKSFCFLCLSVVLLCNLKGKWREIQILCYSSNT